MNGHTGQALPALLLLWSVWGYNWIFMKGVLDYSGPFDFVALRALLGSLTLFALLWWRGKPLAPPPLSGLWPVGLLQTAGFMGLSQWALVQGGAGKTAVLAYTMPFWVLLLAWPVLGERPRGWQWLAVGLAAAGLVLILEPWRLHGTLAANLLAVASGLAWGAGAVLAKRLRLRTQVDLWSLTAWQMLMGALVLVTVALLVPSRPIEFSAYFVLALAYNVLLATALAWLLWFYLLDVLSAGVAGLSALAVPAIGVLAAWLQLGERPSGAEWGGMALVAGGLGLLAALGGRGWLKARALRGKTQR